jgi:hypothetical protein
MKHPTGRASLKEPPVGLILLILLVLLLVGSFPAYPYNRSWGYGPSGLVGLLLVIVLVLVLLNGVPLWFR